MKSNWKTTLLGFLFGAVSSVGQYYQSGGHITVGTVVPIVVATGWGLVQKDFNVTGGTTANVPNEPAVVKETGKKETS